VADLNALGTPSIQITGTLGGTNVALGAGTVSGTMLMDSVVDGVTINYNGSSPRGMQIPASALGAGLWGGDGTLLRVAADQVTIKTNSSGQIQVSTTNLVDHYSITTNGAGALTLKGYANSIWGSTTNTAPVSTNVVIVPYFSVVDTGTNYSLVPNQFISTNITLMAQGTALTNAHGLGNTPALCHVVMVCITADSASGYKPGDEIPVDQWVNNSDSKRTFGWSCNSSNVVIRRDSGTLSVPRAGDGQFATVPTALANFKLKIYARP
jgi:hypothetical protein